MALYQLHNQGQQGMSQGGPLYGQGWPNTSQRALAPWWQPGLLAAHSSIGNQFRSPSSGAAFGGYRPAWELETLGLLAGPASNFAGIEGMPMFGGLTGGLGGALPTIDQLNQQLIGLRAPHAPTQPAPGAGQIGSMAPIGNWQPPAPGAIGPVEQTGMSTPEQMAYWQRTHPWLQPDYGADHGDFID